MHRCARPENFRSPLPLRRPKVDLKATTNGNVLGTSSLTQKYKKIVSDWSRRGSRLQSNKNQIDALAHPEAWADWAWLRDQSLAMGCASAVLGPLCDGMHSEFGVLAYTSPQQPFAAAHWYLQTTWWTPLLFALAGIILGVSHPLLDTVFREDMPRGGTEPSWLWVWAGISVFVFQYYLSAQLDGWQSSPPLSQVVVPMATAIDLILAAIAVAQWSFFDGSRQGFVMAAVTAVCGPALEVALISLGLYSYTHPQLFNAVPTWIPWVYACGGPAVGNLGRKVSAELVRKRRNNTRRKR